MSSSDIKIEVETPGRAPAVEAPSPNQASRGTKFSHTNATIAPKSWNGEEDLALMRAWCHVTSNPVLDSNRNAVKLWQRVLELYEEARADKSRIMGEERTSESLRNRHKRLTANVTKWVGAYREAYGRRRGWMSDKDVEKEAQTIYGKSKFTHMDVFEQVMRHHPKWELKLDVEKAPGSSKKSRITRDVDDDPDNSAPENAVSEASTIRHCTSTEKGKGNCTGSQHSTIPEECNAELHAVRITHDKEMNTMEDIRMQATVLVAKSNELVAKSNMLTTLIGKHKLSPQEESLKYRLMAELFP